MSAMQGQAVGGQFEFVQTDHAGRLLPGGIVPVAVVGDVSVGSVPANVYAGSAGDTLRLCNWGSVLVRLAVLGVDDATPPATASGGIALRAGSDMLMTLPHTGSVWAWAASSTAVNIVAG